MVFFPSHVCCLCSSLFNQETLLSPCLASGPVVGGEGTGTASPQPLGMEPTFWWGEGAMSQCREAGRGGSWAEPQKGMLMMFQSLPDHQGRLRRGGGAGPEAWGMVRSLPREGRQGFQADDSVLVWTPKVWKCRVFLGVQARTGVVREEAGKGVRGHGLRDFLCHA